MMDGLESESLVLLAGESDPSLSDAVPLFEQALDELGLGMPDDKAARWTLARHVLEGVATGEVEPEAGVGGLYWQIADPLHRGSEWEEFGESLDLDEIFGTLLSLDDIPEPPRPFWLFGRRRAEFRRRRQEFVDEFVAQVEARLKVLAAEWLERHPVEAPLPPAPPSSDGSTSVL